MIAPSEFIVDSSFGALMSSLRDRSIGGESRGEIPGDLLLRNAFCNASEMIVG
jgi:hypothetical protein